MESIHNTLNQQIISRNQDNCIKLDNRIVYTGEEQVKKNVIRSFFSSRAGQKNRFCRHVSQPA